MPNRSRARHPLTRQRFTTRLFAWHRGAGRPLAIREAATPWQILVAEVMSHQTQIERVGPAWRRFVETWPSPAALAGAGTRDLLAAWAGLGYNRRALALREAARRIASVYEGEVPATIDALETLPGVGPYTARAVAASAFGVPVAPLDVNVRRVICRVTATPVRAPELQAVADGLVAPEDPRRWLDAVMDLAAGTCTPADPACDACPVADVCASRGVAVEPVTRRAAGPFPATNRWLRGRLVASLTDGPPGAWQPLPEQLGTHGRDAVVAAAEALEREGFLDLRDGQARLRA